MPIVRETGGREWAIWIDRSRERGRYREIEAEREVEREGDMER